VRNGSYVEFWVQILWLMEADGSAENECDNAMDGMDGMDEHDTGSCVQSYGGSGAYHA
jgi:hypothetical protein